MMIGDRVVSYNREHVLASIGIIDILLYRHVVQARLQRAGTSQDEFRGLYISEEDIESILADMLPESAPGPVFENETLVVLDHRLQVARRQMAERTQASSPSGITLRLQRLAEQLHFDAFDMDALLIALAPELHLRYERIFAYLQDDVTRKRPSVDLILSVLCRDLQEKLTERRHFTPGAPLIASGTLILLDEQGVKAPPLLARFVKVDERIVNYLLEHDDIDIRLHGIAEWIEPATRLATRTIAFSDMERQRQLAAMANSTPLVCNFTGPDEAGKQDLIFHVCRDLDLGLLTADVQRMVSAGTNLELLTTLLCRETLLRPAALYLERFPQLDTPENSAVAETIARSFKNHPGLVIIDGDTPVPAGQLPVQRPVLQLDFQPPDTAMREQLWRNHLELHLVEGAGTNGHSLDAELRVLADKFRFTTRQIEAAAATAHTLARWNGGTLGEADLYAAARMHSNQRLGQLARKVVSIYHWDDIVLPPDQLAQLREICAYMRHRRLVYDDWGFKRRLAMGKGINALFAGQSGTGKTMAAGIMGRELGLDVYKIDVSAVVSKYIGETEKNLEQIFREGQDSNAILFFDEADALFGKRSEVKDAHDRYANIEISYLLQRMEEYEGVVILATNFRKNMDDAFVRRLHFVIEFPFPEEADRLRIWKGIFPVDTPLAPAVDLPFIARQFKMAGGNIRNVALAAAFLAAEDGTALTMEHIIRAIRREYQKIGKLITESEFGMYFNLVRPNGNRG